MSMVENEVCEAIASHLKKPRESVTPSTRPGADLGADSLDMAEVVMALEDRLGVDLALKGTSIETVQDIIGHVEKAVALRGCQDPPAAQSALRVD